MIVQVYRQCKTSLILPDSFFFVNSNRRLVLVDIQTKVDALEGIPYILIVFRKNADDGNDAVLVSANGTIVSHTKGLATEAKIGKHELEGKNFSAVWPNAPDITAYCNTVVEYTPTLAFLTRSTRIGNQQFYTVSLLMTDLKRRNALTKYPSIVSRDDSRKLLMQHKPDRRFIEEIVPMNSEIEISDRDLDASESNSIVTERFRTYRSPRKSSNSISSSLDQVKKKLITSMKRDIASAFRQIFLSMGILVIINVLLLVITLLVYLLTVSRYYDSFQLSKEIGIRNSSIGSVGHIVRDFDLQSRGVKSHEDLGMKIDLLLERLQRSEENIRNDFDQANTEEYRELYEKEIIPTWYMEKDAVKLKRMNLFDFTIEFIACFSRVSSRRNDNLTLDDPDMYFLYRNSLGEAADYAKRSSVMYFKENQYFITIFSLILSIRQVVLGTALILGSIVSFSKFGLLQRVSTRLWINFYCLEEDFIHIKLSELEERICRLRGAESSEVILPVQQHRSEVKYHKPWISLMIALAIYTLMVGGSVYVIDALLLKNLEERNFITSKLSEALIQNSVNQLRKWDMMREIKLKDTEYSIYIAVPENNPLSEIEKEFFDSLEISKTNNKLITRLLKTEDVEEFSDISMRYFEHRENPRDHSGILGVLPQTIAFHTSLLQMISQEFNEDTMRTLNKLYETAGDLSDATFEMEQDLLEISSENLLKQQVYDVLVVAAFIIFSLAFFFIVYIPLGKRTRTSIEQSLKFMKLNDIFNSDARMKYT